MDTTLYSIGSQWSSWLEHAYNVLLMLLSKILLFSLIRFVVCEDRCLTRKPVKGFLRLYIKQTNEFIAGKLIPVRWFRQSIGEMNNSGRRLLNFESILKRWLGYCVGYWIKRYLYFSGLRGFMDRHAWARWALPLSRCVRRKHWLHVCACAAQFHNIGGGQFCLPLTLLRLHWTLIVKIL